MPHALFQVTSGRDHLLLSMLICSTTKSSHNGKFLEQVLENVPVREGLLENELRISCCLAKLVLQRSRFIFGNGYNSIMVYWAARVMKGLENGLGC